MTGAPASFFRFDALKAPGDMRPLDVPSIPLSSAQSGSGNRGWAFATWIQIAPPPAGEARNSSILLARFSSSASVMDTELWLIPLDTPQQFRVVVKQQPGPRSAGRKAPSVEGVIKLPSLRWHHIAVSQTQPYIKLIKPPRLSFFLDGQLAFEAVSERAPFPLCLRSSSTQQRTLSLLRRAGYGDAAAAFCARVVRRGLHGRPCAPAALRRAPPLHARRRTARPGPEHADAPPLPLSDASRGRFTRGPGAF